MGFLVFQVIPAEFLLFRCVAVRAAVFSFGTVLVVPWKQNVTLPCQSVGNPEPSVTWKQWGQIVKSSSRVSLLTEGSLQIMDLHREDSGNYTCYVKNRHGSDQITHRLTVQGRLIDSRQFFLEFVESQSISSTKERKKNTHTHVEYENCSLVRLRSRHELTREIQEHVE